MSNLNGQSMNPELRAWLDREIERLTEIRDKWYVAMNMELGRKNGELETLTTLRDGVKVVAEHTSPAESPNGQVHEIEVVSE